MVMGLTGGVAPILEPAIPQELARTPFRIWKNSGLLVGESHSIYSGTTNFGYFSKSKNFNPQKMQKTV